MSKAYAAINLSIWQDPDWRHLPREAQHLYLTLWTHPGLSYCGVVDWRPGRIAAMSGACTAEDIQQAAACLESRLFIVTDDETEECLIRSWARFDGLLKQPRMAVSYANAFATVASNDLRGVIIHETQKIRKIEPELSGWRKQQVIEMLEQTGLDPRARDLPDDPFTPIARGQFGSEFGDRFTPTSDIGLGETRPNVSGSAWGSPTPAPAPAPSLLSPSAAPTSRPASPEPSPEPATAGGERDEHGFAEFWDRYPRKAAQPTARSAWRRATKDATPRQILDGLAKALPELSQRSSPRFIPEPARWLDEHRWEDVAPAEPNPWADIPQVDPNDWSDLDD